MNVLPLLEFGDANDAADLSKGIEGFRGGRGGGFFLEDNNDFAFGEVSRLMRGAVEGFVSVVHCE